MVRHNPGHSAEQDMLQPDEGKYRFLLDNSADILWTIDPGFRWRFITSNVERMINVKARDLIGKPIWGLIAPEDHALVRDMLERQMNGELIPTFEAVLIGAGGKRVPFEVKTSAIVNKEGKAIGIQGISRDIEERKRAEAAAGKLEEKFRDLVENTYDWVWEADRDMVLTYSNPRVLDYLGYAPDEVIGRSLYDFMDPEKAKILAAIMKNTVMQHKQYDVVEKTMISKRGEPVNFEMTVSLRFADGELKGYRGICRNITERKRAELKLYKAYGELEKRVEARTVELVRARATLQAILDTAPIGIIVVDAATNKVTFFSPWMEKIFGHSLTGATYGLKMYPHQLFHPDGSPLVNDELPLFVSLKHKKHVSNMEILVKAVDGSVLTLLVSSAPIVGADGRVTSAVATIVDITRLKSAENELQEAKGQAEMYLDLMGHDINNLNQVGIGFLELALDELRTRGRLEPDDQLLLEKAMETQINSSKLIDNVRKIQKSREGGLKYKALDISDLLETIKDYYSHIPDRKVTIRFSPVKHCYVNANDLIWDVFTNLVGNAIKHSSPLRPLEIDMGIKRVAAEGRDLYRITIEDNGPGIPDELKGRLFTRFRKGKTKTSGRGLGLYLVKTLLEDFNGSVSVEDRVKGDHRKGTRFTVMLPALKKEEAGFKAL